MFCFVFLIFSSFWTIMVMGNMPLKDIFWIPVPRSRLVINLLLTWPHEKYMYHKNLKCIIGRSHWRFFLFWLPDKTIHRNSKFFSVDIEAIPPECLNENCFLCKQEQSGPPAIRKVLGYYSGFQSWPLCTKPLDGQPSFPPFQGWLLLMMALVLFQQGFLLSLLDSWNFHLYSETFMKFINKNIWFKKLNSRCTFMSIFFVVSIGQYLISFNLPFLYILERV